MDFDPAALDAAILAAALGPQHVRTEAGEFQARSAQDLIALANYSRALQASKEPRRGLMITVLNPSGAVGRDNTTFRGSV